MIGSGHSRHLSRLIIYESHFVIFGMGSFLGTSFERLRTPFDQTRPEGAR